MSTIKDELDQKRQESITKTKEPKPEIKLLMSPDADSSKAALRTAGLDHNIKEATKKQGIEIERKQYEERYGNSVFTLDEVRDICIKYDLRCLRTQHFNGELDTVVAEKLAEFIEANKNEMGDRSDSFYIIAPPEAFELRYEQSYNPKRNHDHTLLYKVSKADSQQQDQFVFIHKWGEEGSFLRRIRGYFFESVFNMYTILASSVAIILSTIFGIFFDGFTGEWYQYLNLIWIVGLSFAGAAGIISLMFDEDKHWERRTTDNLWNTDKVRRNLNY